MHFDISQRYDKTVIEPFAQTVIANSFDKSYQNYIQPHNPDNFDYISPDGKRALEISIVISQNEKRACQYEKALLKKGKDAVRVPRRKDFLVDKNNRIIAYGGGSMFEIRALISNRIVQKNDKARRRLQLNNIDCVDLCLCIVDGSLFDLQSFELSFSDLDHFVFNRFFFITPSHFILYEKGIGFKEYPRKLSID